MYITSRDVSDLYYLKVTHREGNVSFTHSSFFVSRLKTCDIVNIVVACVVNCESSIPVSIEIGKIFNFLPINNMALGQIPITFEDEYKQVGTVDEPLPILHKSVRLC